MTPRRALAHPSDALRSAHCRSPATNTPGVSRAEPFHRAGFVVPPHNQAAALLLSR